MVFDRTAVCAAAASLPPSDRRGIAMSDPSSSGTEKTGSSKKRVSPARNILGLVILLAVAAVAWFQLSPKFRYNAAVKALEARANDEQKDLLSVKEAESLLGKSPDGPGSDVQDIQGNFTKKTYTWSGLFKSYTLTTFYTKEKDSRLHHFETEGEKYAPEPPAASLNPPSNAGPVRAKAPAGSPTPAKGPVPTKTPTSVPTKAETPAPAKTETPAPKKAETPAPAKTETPAPAKTETPAPKKAETSAPKKAETPAPAETPK